MARIRNRFTRDGKKGFYARPNSRGLFIIRPKPTECRILAIHWPVPGPLSQIALKAFDHIPCRTKRGVCEYEFINRDDRFVHCIIDGLSRQRAGYSLRPDSHKDQPAT